jgi:YD repeat-containing protein
MIRFRHLIFVVFSFLAMSVSAGVNIKNGNFYISYSDHDLTQFNGFEMMRTYNSKSVEKGLFGFGWGSEIETRLYIIGDGHIIIKEHGSGAPNQFSPVEEDEARITECINQLVKAALIYEDVENNPVSINEFRRKMRSSLEDRFKKWLLYSEEGLLKEPTLSLNEKWISYDLGYQQLLKTKTGFQRTNDDGSYDLFNNKGLFTGRYTAGGRTVYSISYDANNRIAQLKDKAGHIFTFTIDKEGRAATIKSKQGISYYWYEGTLLVKTKDVANNTYRHSYDSSYNMIAIDYTDGTRMLIEYESTTLFCKKVTDPKGNVTEYQYKTLYDAAGNVNDNHYATLVLSKPKDSTKTDSTYYEYEIKDKPDGSSYTYHFYYNKNGEEFEELNNEECELPIFVRKGTFIDSFTYNNNCITISKVNDTMLVTAEIDTAWNKASRITVVNKKTNLVRDKTIRYNNSGNPVLIIEGADTTTIRYSAAQQVTAINFQQGELLYKYDSFEQLISVTLTGTGVLQFVYDKEGTLLKKESKQGTEVAAKIETVYNELQKRIGETIISFDF